MSSFMNLAYAPRVSELLMQWRAAHCSAIHECFVSNTWWLVVGFDLVWSLHNDCRGCMVSCPLDASAWASMHIVLPCLLCMRGRALTSLAHHWTYQQELHMHCGTVVVLPLLCNQWDLLPWHGPASKQNHWRLSCHLLGLNWHHHYFGLGFRINFEICLFCLGLLQLPFLLGAMLLSCGNDGACCLSSHHWHWAILFLWTTFVSALLEILKW